MRILDEIILKHTKSIKPIKYNRETNENAKVKINQKK